MKYAPIFILNVNIYFNYSFFILPQINMSKIIKCYYIITTINYFRVIIPSYEVYIYCINLYLKLNDQYYYS